ncbi:MULTISPECIES: hypothetical protein [unclassified Lentimicrobium]|uniref:hypothetical protein n=1 Tax=unclassified Lentimicrobium TaxID=2677434 RepID=UPI001553DC50|nr:MULTISPECIES: hypothetical protein [unclassified Lentimicrobium]NPD45640.1 hypothetical protein [Lentimicrobium sp. S6]NPD85068.1 hypothetical protein [Lentimicrobium sp. L6]
MKSEIASTNETFQFLSGSSEFLNIILNNINSCVLLLNDKMELQAFNDSLKTIFSRNKNEDLRYKRCGEAIGCAFHIEEGKDCGETTQCCNCELRVAALQSYVNDEVIYNDRITKPFLTFDNERVEKQLQFSTRLFLFRDEKYIIMLVEDITDLIHPDNKIAS